MKFLVLGATGMAGHTITYFLRENGHNVTTYSRTHFPLNKGITGDITDSSFFRSIISDDYDVIINCIGILNEACDKDPEKAIFLNSYLPHAIVNRIKDTDTKLIHLSTDCVFSGKAAPYSEKSKHDGETLYDRTKSLGEVACGRHLTFRNSIIGPDIKESGIGLLNWFMKQSGTINGYTGAIWNGVTTLTLAKAIEKAATDNLTGLYHLVHPTSVNKYELLQLFNKHLKENKMTILPSPIVQLDKTLLNSRQDFSFTVPSYEEMIVEMHDWIFSHKNLYPHYFK
ncbi:NAD(P)-dependent oxidoreductase [Solibacillus sp. R5-41]|uniref:dTDP-4-dehydrorhamnose reductase family protein n=1 Tax=Solibacillus sp. R5-41 TaxID=2048654 RepID=UPI000C1255CC|nr:SDR family oxidoreductase [Solibacillus sp. R5-41]ATP40608.1 NAD(P)-dependent oxidoreductase [Solibacillus sp. R5-41]